MAVGAAKSSHQVWDIGVRIFHWLLAICFLIAWQSAERDNFFVHRIAGYTILTLVLFRIGWGIWGGETARFAQFVRGPGAVLFYLKSLPARRPSHWLGHNPLGALAVLALIGLMLAQVTTGLFAIDTDFVKEGPLSANISYEAARTAAELHETIFNVLMVVVILHIAAVVFYLIWKKENLIRPMVTGKVAGEGVSARSGSLPALVLTAAGATAIVWAIVSFG